VAARGLYPDDDDRVPVNGGTHVGEPARPGSGGSSQLLDRAAPWLEQVPTLL